MEHKYNSYRLTWAEEKQEEQGGGRLRLTAAGGWAWLQLAGAQLGPCFLMMETEEQEQTWVVEKNLKIYGTKTDIFIIDLGAL